MNVNITRNEFLKEITVSKRAEVWETLRTMPAAESASGGIPLCGESRDPGLALICGQATAITRGIGDYEYDSESSTSSSHLSGLSSSFFSRQHKRPAPHTNTTRKKKCRQGKGPSHKRALSNSQETEQVLNVINLSKKPLTRACPFKQRTVFCSVHALPRLWYHCWLS